MVQRLALTDKDGTNKKEPRKEGGELNSNTLASVPLADFLYVLKHWTAHTALHSCHEAPGVQFFC